jgi:hypothetical protein
MGHYHQYTFLEQFTKSLEWSYGYHGLVLENLLLQINLLALYNMVYSTKEKFSNFNFC